MGDILYVGGICFGSYRPQVHRHRLATLKQNLLPYTTHAYRATHLTHTYVCTCTRRRGCCLCTYSRVWDPGEPPAHLEMGLGVRCQQRGAGELLEDFGEARSGLLNPHSSPTAPPPVALPAAQVTRHFSQVGACWQCSCRPSGARADPLPAGARGSAAARPPCRQLGRNRGPARLRKAWPRRPRSAECQARGEGTAFCCIPLNYVQLNHFKECEFICENWKAKSISCWEGGTKPFVPAAARGRPGGSGFCCERPRPCCPLVAADQIDLQGRKF